MEDQKTNAGEEVLRLRNFKLNPALRFFDHQGNRYGFLARAPHPPSYLRLDRETERLIRRLAHGGGAEPANRPEALSNQGLAFMRAMEQAGLLLPEKAPDLRPDLHQPPPRAAGMFLLLTTDCNLRCVYCYSAAGDRRAITLSDGHIAAGMDHFFRHLPPTVGLVRLVLQGAGEPTQAFETAKEAWEDFKWRAAMAGLKFRLAMVSNGNYSQEVLKWLVEERVRLTISLDGPAEVHDRQRPRADGHGSFARAADALRAVAAAGLKPKARSTITRRSLESLPRLLPLLREWGVDELQVEPCREVGRAAGQGDMEPDAGHMAGLFMEVVKAGWKEGIRVRSSTLVCLRSGRGQFCEACRPIFALTPQGFVTSCPEVSLPEDEASHAFFYGEINSQGEVVLDETRLQGLRARRAETIQPCAACLLADCCGGGCPVKAFRAAGRLQAKDGYLCALIQKINREMIALTADGEIAPPAPWKTAVTKWDEPAEGETPLRQARLVTIFG